MNDIICGNALTEIKKLDSDSIDLICIDPPYLTTNEKWDKEEVISGELTNELFRVLKDTGNFYCWCGIGEKSQSLIRWFSIFSKYFHFKDLITWKKCRGIGMRRGWLYTREEIMWFVKDNKKFIWNKKEQYNLKSKRTFTLPNNKSEYNRYSNVWTDIKEINQSIVKNSEISEHYGQKPLEAIDRIIKLHTKKNDIVLDCFMGSGTTCVSAKSLGRQYIGIDIEQKWCDITNSRLKNVC